MNAAFVSLAGSARQCLSALCLISLLFLTNFRLGDWIRRPLKEPAEAEPEFADEIASALYTGWPVLRSHTTVVSRWL